MPEAVQAAATETPTATATTGTETQAAPKTLAESGATDSAPKTNGSAPAFPETWREMLAGEDKTALKDLQRFTDPAALAKSYRELRTERDSGKVKPVAAPPGDNATPEQKTAWRTSQGLPDKAETYVTNIALGDGVVLSDGDKPLMGNFAEMAMAKNWSQGQFNDAVSWFYDAQQAIEQQRLEGDGSYRTTAQTELMTDWGPGDYKTNMNAVGSLLATMDKDMRSTVLAARTPDGRLVGDTPEFLKWAAAHIREFNPAATLISPSEGNIPKAIQSEMANIESVLAKANSGDREAYHEYYGRDGKPGLDARWRELYAAQQQMAERKGVA
jgi:hypothetical protein